MGYTVLIAEDDEEVLKILARYFSAGGFTVYSAENNAEAVRLAGQYRPDCLLLDYHLADGPASGVCRYVRGDECLKNTPIVIMSGDRLQAANSYENCQADAFVEKGLSCSTMLAVVKRQLRRDDWADGRLVKADLTLDAPNQRLLRNSYPPIQLSPGQFQFLSVLLEKSPCFVSEKDLCARVFGDTRPEGRPALWSLAYRLRRKLGPQLSRRIKNTRNRGWICVQPRLYGRPRRAVPQQV